MNTLCLPQSVIDLLPVAICVCSAPSGHVIQFNRSAAELWGREPELNCDSARYCGAFKVLTREGVHIPHDRTAMATVLESGVPVRALECILERPDGSRRRVMANIDPIRDPSGQIIGAMNVSQDVTKRPETEAGLRSSESWLQQLMNSGLFGIFHWTLDDEGGCITDANDVFVAMTGYTREDMRSGRVRRENITLQGDQEPRRKAVEQLLAVGVTTPYETEFVAEDGHRVPMLLHGAMLDREKRSGVSVVMDLSELHAMRKKTQLLEAQLVHTQKMEAVGQLAGGVAHDFNNLLMVISSQAELLLETTDHSKVEEKARRILSATDSAGQLTRKLLAFGRKQELASSTFDLNHLLSETTDLINDLMPKNIAVDGRLSPDPCWVHADRVQIEQTLINLVLNARDAMPEGGRLVLGTSAIVIDKNEVGLHGSVPAGEYALITVADTGQGIPEQLLGRVFEPFFTTKPRERGTGLGLAIAHGIVSQSGGHLRVSSKVNGGTTFSVYLPSAERPRKERPNSRPCPLGRSNASCAREGTILLVDDEELVRTSVRMFLEQYGLKVVDCADAVEALRIGSELKDEVALLITDFVMPKMTGSELAESLLSHRPELPIIFMSGYAAGEVGHERFKGARFLQKPFTRSKLAETVCKGMETCPRRIPN